MSSYVKDGRTDGTKGTGLPGRLGGTLRQDVRGPEAQEGPWGSVDSLSGHVISLCT